jgi:hypothetical protein
MEHDYPWVANWTKLQVAIQKIKSKNGSELNEESIKEEYIRMGGLVLSVKLKPGRPKKNAENTDLDSEKDED